MTLSDTNPTEVVVAWSQGEQLHEQCLTLSPLLMALEKWYPSISGKSQILFALVYTTRYLDLLTSFISTYNTVMKVVFIGTSYVTLYLIYVKFKATYDHSHDSFRIEFLVIAALLMALFFNYNFCFIEVTWTFSIYLEAVAILPQLHLARKTEEVDALMCYYVLALALYRGMYVRNWIYRYIEESHHDIISFLSGLFQTLLCVYTAVVMTKYHRCRRNQEHNLSVIHLKEDLNVRCYEVIHSPPAKMDVSDCDVAMPYSEVMVSPAESCNGVDQPKLQDHVQECESLPHVFQVEKKESKSVTS